MYKQKKPHHPETHIMTLIFICFTYFFYPLSLAFMFLALYFPFQFKFPTLLLCNIILLELKLDPMGLSINSADYILLVLFLVLVSFN